VGGEGGAGGGGGGGGVGRGGRGPAGRAGVHETIRRAGRADTITALGDVTRPRRGAADAGALHVGRAIHAGTGARFGGIAIAGRRAADSRGRLQGIRRTRIADAVAAFGRVTRTRRRPAHGGALRVDSAPGAPAATPRGPPPSA